VAVEKVPQPNAFSSASLRLLVRFLAARLSGGR